VKLMDQPFTVDCCTVEKFRAAREWLEQSGGGATAVRDALRVEGVVEAAGDALTLGVKPFNVFARLAGGVMPNPVDQSVLGKHGGEFVVCHNRPENDADWEDATKVATASMAGPDPKEIGGLPGHVFITCKDMRWDRFNVLVMGMEGTPVRSDGDANANGDGAATASGAAPAAAAAVAFTEARAFLQRLEAAARSYVAARGWDLSTTGMFFHVYPLCSVNSLHMHIVNLACKGPALHHHAHKNMPLADVLTAFLP